MVSVKTRAIASGDQRKCGACVLVGHNKKTKICRMYSAELNEARATNNLAQGPKNCVVRPHRRFQRDEYDFDSCIEHVPSGIETSESEDDRLRAQHLESTLKERNQLRNPVLQPSVIVIMIHLMTINGRDM